MGKIASGKPFRIIVSILLFLIPPLFFPGWWCGMEAADYYCGKTAGVYEPLAAEVESIIMAGVSDRDFNTGNRQFDGEWQFGAHQMAGLGMCQFIAMFPEKRERYLPVVETCISKLLTPQAREFDTKSWNEDAIASLDGPNAHAAYLGYLNLLLSVYRGIAPNPKFNAIHDRITAALVRRLESSPIGMIETYPGEVYPVDNTSVIASLGEYDRVTGSDHRGLIGSWTENLKRRYIDTGSGMLIQALDPKTGSHTDKPRASGSALGAYFLSFVDKTISAELYKSTKNSCGWRLAGFGALYEYPGNVTPGYGDIDSGPLVFGLSMSATGFAISSARINRDPEFFREMYAMGYLFGYPLEKNGRRYFALGGPLGTSIMLAMVTAGGRI